MDRSLAEALSSLPSLSTNEFHKLNAECKICSAESHFFDVVDFNRFCSFPPEQNGFGHAFGLANIAVPYVRCPYCGFLFTSFFDDWSHEDFKKYIYNDEYIKVDPDYVSFRALGWAEAFSGLLQNAKDLRILDYGSGTGGFEKNMNVSSYDPFSSTTRPAGRFDIITCIEVVEHTTDPSGTLDDILTFLNPGGIIILSQLMQPENIKMIRGHWWYLGPRNGHVSTYTTLALAQLAAQKGYQLRGQGNCWSIVPLQVNPVFLPILDQIGPYHSPGVPFKDPLHDQKRDLSLPG